MIHPDLSNGARELLAISDAAADSGSLAALASITLPVIGRGLHLAMLEMTIYCLCQEMEQL